MIFRHDQITVDLPAPNGPNANAAAAVQELLGGKFGEMSTLMNYTFQSFNFRGKKNFRPFFDLIANIASEEYGHIEAVSATINVLLTGTTPRDDRNHGAKTGGTVEDPTKKHADAKSNPAPLKEASNFRNTDHFLNSGQTALPQDAMGRFWTGQNVFSSGNLKLDLLHNFFLECGARAGKSRAYESTDDPCARAMIGYLLVRGGTHIIAYAKALEVLTGVNVSGLLPIPDVSNRKFPEARKLEEEQGLHLVQYHHSKDYTQIAKIWNGPHPEDGQPLVVKDELPKGYPWPDLDDEPQLVSPSDIDPDMIKYYSDKLG